MKIYKLLALAAVPVFALTACTDEVEYTPSAPAATPEAYMSYDNVNKFDLNEGQSSINFYIYRANEHGAASINLTSSAVNTGSEETGVKDEAVTFFSVPSTVDFADGQKRALVTVDFPFEDLIPYDNYKLTVKIDGSFTTDYVLGQDTFTLFYIPWQPVPNIDGTPGNSMCLYIDPLTTTIVNFGEDIPEEDRTWECPIQEHPKNPGFYRVAEPYAPKYNIWCQDILAEDYNYVGLPDDEVRYLYIHAEDKDYVYFESWWTGWDPVEAWGYVQFFYMNLIQYWLDNGDDMETLRDEASGNFGKNIDGYIYVAKANTRFIDAPRYGQGWISPSYDFQVLLPGATIPEPEVPEVKPVPVKPEGSWSKLGTGKFDDGLLAPAFGLEGQASYDVEVYVDGENASRFLVVNPYNNEFWEEGVKYPELEYYLEFDCSDPNCVIIPVTMTGVYASEEQGAAAKMTYVSDAQAILYYVEDMSGEEIVDAGFTSSYSDGVITIGAESGAFGFGDDYAYLDVYEEGYATTLVLPGTDLKAHYITKSVSNGAKFKARFNAIRANAERLYNRYASFPCKRTQPLQKVEKTR